jgi:3-dehydroquinate synthase
LPPDDRQRAVELLKRFGLPVRAPSINAVRGRELMGMDKKVLDRKLRLVLIRKLGQAEMVSDYPNDILDATLREHFG